MNNGFVDGMRRIVYPVCIASSVHEEVGVSMTVSSVTSVSIEPPTLLVCLNRSSSMAACAEVGRLININFLCGSHEKLAKVCSSKESKRNRLDSDLWKYDKNKLPYIENSEMTAFCTVSKIVSHATHLIVIVSVNDVICSSDPRAEPLLYQSGKYLTI